MVVHDSLSFERVLKKVQSVVNRFLRVVRTSSKTLHVRSKVIPIKQRNELVVVLFINDRC